MVNTGKPSGACGVCRERRIRCDEAKPACLKCVRSGRICSGYSNGLKVRDQTQKTILKARLGKSTRAKHRKNTRSQEDNNEDLRSPLSSSQVGGSPKRQSSASLRRSSLPEHGEEGTGGPVAVKKGHKRSASGSAVTQQQLRWSFQWQIAEDETVDPQLWRPIHTPLVEQARCYFLSSQST